MGAFTDLINNKPAKNIVIPQYAKPNLNTDLKISAPTGKSLTLEQLPTVEREKARAEIRQSDLKLAGKKTNFLQVIAQSFPRAVMSFGLETIKGGEIPYTAKTNFEKLLYGEEPVKSVSQKAIEAEPLASSIVGKKAGLPVSTVVAFGLTALDLTPFGGTKKGLTKEIIETATDDVAKALLKKAGVADDLAEAYASQVVKAKTAKEAEAIITRLDELAKTTTKTTPLIDPLAQEARKYKSAEEFVKAQELLYHGTDKTTADAIRKAGGFTDETAKVAKDLTGYGVPANKPISLTLDEATGKLYAGPRPLGGEGEMLTFSGKGLKIADEATANKLGKNIEKLKQAGYDGYHTSSPHDEMVETVVFNKEKLKLTTQTKSQLTDIYNQAVKTAPEAKLGGKVLTEVKIPPNTSKALNFDIKTNTYTPKRQAIHTQIINEELNKVPSGNKTFNFVTGHSGSGKSRFVTETIDEGQTLVVDPDRLKPKLPEFGTKGGPFVHDETSDLAVQIARQAMNDGKPITWVGNVKDSPKYREFLNIIKELGYDITTNEVKTSRSVALERVAQRSASGKQVMPISFAEESYNEFLKGSNLLKKYSSKFDSYSGEEDFVQQFLKKEGKPTGKVQLPKQATQPLENKIIKSPQRLEESLEQTLKTKGKNPQIVSSLTNDTTKLIKNIGVNVDNLNISDLGKKLINETIQEVKPALQQKVGKVLTNKEVIETAERSAKILKGSVEIEATKNWEVALLNARKKLAASAESGTVDRDFIENLLTIKTQGTDIARKLQSFGIGADPQNITSKQAILEAILKQNQNVEEILRASKGVDFNDFNQATEFYRKFIKPTAGEWIDLLRYNSMLSSPKTHLVNTFSNLLNSSLIAPLEKSIQGGIDFLSSKITGNARKVFVGESVQFIRGYFSNLRRATSNFASVLKGKSPITQLDLKYIPFSKEGASGKVAKVLSYPTRLLEASDRFFMDLTQAGERAALEFRASKGAAVKEIEEKALDAAKYRLYRQELFSPEQGRVLDAVDHFTSTLMNLRNAKNPIVSTVSKFTVPFVKTPMNIFKQGVEYSPLGFSTLIGAKNKQQQLAKAILGSTFFAGAATLVASDRLTGAEPRDTTGIRDWRSAGKQAYSVKIGNKWVSYQKFPPAISFSFSLLSTINDTLRDKKIDDSIVDTTLSAVSKYGQFLSDQSYAKSIGDMLGSIQGGEAGIERLISNYPQQLIPFRALGSWFARMFDASQRKVDSQADFIDKQIQQLFINMPFLSMTVPAREDKDGNPIPNYNRFWNAFSPVDIKTENEKFTKFLNDKEQFNEALKTEQDRKTLIKEEVRPVYDNIQKLVSEGKTEEAKKIVNELTDEQYEQYKLIKSADKTKQTTELEAKVFPTYKKIQELLSAGNEQEAKNIVDSLTNEEYRAYKLIKNRLQ